MERESYWDYMGRRMREDRKNNVSLTSIESELFRRIEELEHKVAVLGSHPQQLEMDL